MNLSVALCTYNGEKFLTEQLDSILNQTQKITEIIVCDDGSTDQTISILENYNVRFPNLFKIHKNEHNLRSVKNFEKAISLCTGEIIFLSDQDDIWVGNKVEDYVSYFNNHPNINVLASNGYCIDQNSIVHEKYAFWDAPQFLRDKNIDVDYFKIITHISNIATGASMAFRKSIVNDILPFPLMNNFHHDEWIALISSATSSFDLLNKKYFYYRIHDSQQVGGVFYEKNETNRQYLTDFFDFNSQQITFKIFRKRLRKNRSFLALNQQLINQCPTKKDLINKNIISCSKQISLLKDKLKKNNIYQYYLYKWFYK